MIDKWFAAQASSSHPQVLQHVKKLVEHSAFDIYNPNRVYSVFRQFAKANPYGFHHPSGEGYRLVADYVLKINGSNSQVAAMLANLLSRYQKFDQDRQKLMKANLQRIADHENLSRDVFEVVSKSLKA